MSHKSINFKDKKIYIHRNKEEILNKCIKDKYLQKDNILNILIYYQSYHIK